MSYAECGSGCQIYNRFKILGSSLATLCWTVCLNLQFLARKRCTNNKLLSVSLALLLAIPSGSMSWDSDFFIARTIQVSDDEREAYFKHFQDAVYPVWKTLQDDGLLHSNLVLVHDSVISENSDMPNWNVLLLIRLATGVQPQEFLDEELRRQDSSADAPGRLLRQEVLVPTPRSFHPGGKANVDTQYFVEYINVWEGHLDEYRNSMIENSGPANGLLVEQGAILSFIGLETVSVDFSAGGMPSWNQIHLGGIPATETFDPLDVNEFDDAIKSVSPDSGGFADVFGRLDEIRDKPKEVIGHPIVELQLPGPD